MRDLKIKLIFCRDDRRGHSWCLRVTVETTTAHATARTWYGEYPSRRVPPPPQLTGPDARMCEDLARRALAG